MATEPNNLADHPPTDDRPLSGHYKVSSDDRGRIVLPAPFRYAFDGDEAIVGPAPDEQTLWILPVPVWKRILKALPRGSSDENVIKARRFYTRYYFPEKMQGAAKRVDIRKTTLDYVGFRSGEELEVSGEMDKLVVQRPKRWKVIMKEDQVASAALPPELRE